MAIIISCSECGTKAQVPDSAAGARGKCRACGAVVEVLVKPQKTCCACGIDVSQQPRTKDEQGRYYCNPCWSDRQNTLLKPDAVPPESGATVASASSFWSSDTGIIAAILIPLLIIGAAICGWLLWSSHADQQIRGEIVHLKEMADQRLAAGDVQAASKQYADVLDFAAKHKIKDDASGTLEEVRREKEAADAKIVKLAEALQKERQPQESVIARPNAEDQATTAVPIDSVELLKQQISSEVMAPDKLLACLKDVAQGKRSDAEPLILQLQSRLSGLRTWEATHQIAVKPNPGDIYISPNGRYVLYASSGTGKMDVLDDTAAQSRPWGDRWQLAFVGSDRVVLSMYSSLVYCRTDDGKRAGAAKLPIEEDASFEYGWIAASPSGKLVARFGPVSRGIERERGYGKPIFVVDATSGATAALLNGGDTQTACFAPLGPSTLVSAGEAEMTVWDLSRTGGRLLNRINPKTRPAPSNQVTVPWIGISYGRDVSVYPYRSGVIESYNIDTGKLTRHLDVSGCDSVYGMTPDGSKFLLAMGSSSPPDAGGHRTTQAILFDANLKQQKPLPGVWKSGAMSLNGQTLALLSNERLVVMQSRATEPWQTEADNLCNAYLLGRWGDSDAAMLADASAGRGDIEAKNRMEEVAHDQKEQADREAAAIAKSQHDAEFGADKPRAIAAALIQKAKQDGKLRDGKFLNYFESGGFHQWDKLPSSMNEIGLRFSFEFVTQAGLVRVHDGYIMFRHEGGKWEPFVINVDGMGDISVKVFTEGGFVIR